MTALRRAGPPDIFSGLSGGPALEASLSHPTSSAVRQSNYLGAGWLASADAMTNTQKIFADVWN